jgi:hypothetical protein
MNDNENSPDGTWGISGYPMTVRWDHGCNGAETDFRSCPGAANEHYHTD